MPAACFLDDPQSTDYISAIALYLWRYRTMFARIKLPAFFLIAMMFPMALTAATEKQVNYSRMTHGGKVVVGKAMDIGREH